MLQGDSSCWGAAARKQGEGLAASAVLGAVSTRAESQGSFPSWSGLLQLAAERERESRDGGGALLSALAAGEEKLLVGKIQKDCKHGGKSED